MAHAGYTVPAEFVDELVVAGFDQPVNLGILPDGRTFVIERVPARVRLVVDGALSPVDPVLTVDSVLTNDGERGLLGIALDPDWPARPYIYLDYTYAGGPWIRVSRFRAQGDLAFTGDGQVTFDPASRYDVLRIPDLSPIHNGGSLRFGPDGMLYVAVGDDGVACHAQDRTILRGKILRVDVGVLPDGPGGNPPLALITPADNPFAPQGGNAGLVWAWGLRNPYSFEFDPLDGRLFIADVGAASYEEIDLAATGGLNFQWPIYEGPLRTTFQCAGVDSSSWVPPVYSYDRTVGATVIAGFVYRRPSGAPAGFPLDHEGSFWFTDFYTGILRRLVPGPGTAWIEAPPVPGQPGPLDWGNDRLWVSAFFQAPDGSVLYTQNWLSFPQPTGELRRIRRAFVTGTPPIPARRALSLATPRPNPSRESVHLAFDGPGEGPIRLTVHDVSGRLVRTLIAPEEGTVGSGQVGWDGSDDRGRRAPAGVYRLRLVAPGGVRTTPIVRLGAPGD